MSIASQYGNCYWNASGEFECKSSNQLIDRKILERSHKMIPSSNVSNFDALPPQYARIPIDQNIIGRKAVTSINISRPFVGKQSMCSNIYENNNEKLSPLNREMEVSIYLPNREVEFPWNHSSSVMENETKSDHPLSSSPISQPSGEPVPLNKKVKIFAPTQIQGSMSPFFVQTLGNNKKLEINWNQTSQYFNKYRTQVNKYYFQLPYQKYEDLVNEFGPPTLINPNKGGIAIWQSRLLKNAGYKMIKRIDLIDEQCFNSFPYPHIGFLYTYVKINIPLSKLGNVLSLCGDLMYDPIKHILVARGMSLSYNIAIIAIVCLYINGKITWYNIKDGNLVKQSTNYKRLTNRKVQKQNLAILNKYITKV